MSQEKKYLKENLGFTVFKVEAPHHYIVTWAYIRK